jgi:PDZ domain-containing protein
MTRRGLTLLGGVLVTALLTAGVAVAPVPYVVLAQGPTVDVLGTHDGEQVIRIDGATTAAPAGQRPAEQRAAGQLRMTTVDVTTEISMRQAVESWFGDDRALVPRETVLPAGLSPQQVQQRNTAEFTTSQTAAETAAERELGRPVTATIRLDEIGGPSAGLMFALGIIDEAGPEDLTGGRIIAGTGTIDDQGAVGPIGGIPQKLRGAAAAHATFFLVPAANCAEAVRNAVPGLATIKVGTLAEALSGLRALVAGGVPVPCPVG